MTGQIRVLVVDDQLLTRRGLMALLLGFKDIELVGEARNGVEALALCARANPDVILIDLVMPELDGAETTRQVHEQYPNIQVIGLTNFDEFPIVKRALNAGADGILPKNLNDDDLVANIRRVHANCRSPETKEIEEILQSIQMSEFPALDENLDLTDREFDVLELMGLGLTNPQIARKMFVSRATVKSEVSTILSKLGVSSRTGAVGLAVKLRLINGPGQNEMLPVL